MTACLLTESWFQCVTILAKQLLAAKTEMQNNSFEQRVHLISSQPPVAFFANARCLCNTKKIQSLQTLLKESTLSHATQQLLPGTLSGLLPSHAPHSCIFENEHSLPGAKHGWWRLSKSSSKLFALASQPYTFFLLNRLSLLLLRLRRGLCSSRLLHRSSLRIFLEAFVGGAAATPALLSLSFIISVLQSLC